MIKTPIGTISDTMRGKMIKIAPRSWCSYAKFVWEQAHNEKLPVGTSFVFMDGNKNNYDVNNLYPLARKHIIVKQSITYPTTKDEMDTRCLIADLHAKKNAVEIEIYGGSLNVLKKNIMKDPKRLEEYKAKQRERANKTAPKTLKQQKYARKYGMKPIRNTSRRNMPNTESTIATKFVHTTHNIGWIIRKPEKQVCVNRMKRTKKNIWHENAKKDKG